MRLIDADAIRIPDDAPYKASVRRVIAMQPTVEAEPVVHGEWIWKPEDERTEILTCSVCASDKGANELYNYCPNCGAKMRDK